MITKQKSYRINEQDQKLIDSLMIRYNLTTEIGAIRYALMLVFNSGGKQPSIDNEENVKAINDLIKVLPKGPSEQEVEDYIQYWQQHANFGTFCPIHTMTSIMNCGCLKHPERLRSHFISTYKQNEVKS